MALLEVMGVFFIFRRVYVMPPILVSKFILLCPIEKHVQIPAAEVPFVSCDQSVYIHSQGSRGYLSSIGEKTSCFSVVDQSLLCILPIVKDYILFITTGLIMCCMV